MEETDLKNEGKEETTSESAIEMDNDSKSPNEDTALNVPSKDAEVVSEASSEVDPKVDSDPKVEASDATATAEDTKSQETKESSEDKLNDASTTTPTLSTESSPPPAETKSSAEPEKEKPVRRKVGFAEEPADLVGILRQPKKGAPDNPTPSPDHVPSPSSRHVQFAAGVADYVEDGSEEAHLKKNGIIRQQTGYFVDDDEYEIDSLIPPGGVEIDEDDDPPLLESLMRVLVLLIDPASKEYELTPILFEPPKTMGGEVVKPGPPLSDFLKQLKKAAKDKNLAGKEYTSFCRSDGVEMINTLYAKDLDFEEDEILFAIPKELTGSETAKIAETVMQIPLLVTHIAKVKKDLRRLRDSGNQDVNPFVAGQYEGDEGFDLTADDDDDDDFDPYAKQPRSWTSTIMIAVVVYYILKVILTRMYGSPAVLVAADGSVVTDTSDQVCIDTGHCDVPRGLWKKIFGIL